MAEHAPGVRRLCVAAETAASTDPGMLRHVCDAVGPGRLYVESGEYDGIELAIAPPGTDEMTLVTRLMAELLRRADTRPAPSRPLVAAFHVGITRIVEDGFGGTGVTRVRELLRHPALRAAVADHVAAGRRYRLAVAISAGLFDDLRAEGLPSVEWRPVGAATAWLRLAGGADGSKTE